jgi:hypothetical protein
MKLNRVPDDFVVDEEKKEAVVGDVDVNPELNSNF